MYLIQRVSRFAAAALAGLAAAPVAMLLDLARATRQKAITAAAWGLASRQPNEHSTT
jgi:hypothetical protein